MASHDDGDEVTKKGPLSLDEIEHASREVLAELEGDEKFSRFRKEYEKLHTALRKAHDNETRLIEKCSQLNQELMSNASKVGTAMKMDQDAQQSIGLLKKELSEAWRACEQEHAKQARSEKTTQLLKDEIKNLTDLVSQGAGLSIGQENTVKELREANEKLNGELEDQRRSIKRHERRIDDMTKKVSHLEDTKATLEQAHQSLQDTFQRTKTELNREKRHNGRIQDELLNVKELADTRKSQLNERDDSLRHAREEYKSLDMESGELLRKCERFHRTSEEFRQKNVSLEALMEDHLNEQTRLMIEKDTIINDFKKTRDELAKSQEETRTAIRGRDRLAKEKELVERQKATAEQQRDFLRNEITTIQKELEIQAKNADVDEKLIKDLQTQVRRLDSTLQMSKQKNRSHDEQVREFRDERRALGNDLQVIKQEEQQLRKENCGLEREHEKAVLVGANWQQRFQETNEKLKMTQLEVSELQQKIQEEKNKLKVQQALYEGVRADRNLFSQQHIEAQDEIGQMKRKMKIMTHQIEQLKEENSTKDQALIKQHFEVKHKTDVEKMLRKQVVKKDGVLQQADQLLSSQDVEIKTLRRTLAEAEQNQKQQKTVFDDVVDERDILGAQLIRRNDEIALLYEKIRIMQSTLNKGEVQYNERVEDISMLKLKLSDLKRQLEIRNGQVSNMDALKNEVYHLQRELLQERTKVKALSEELENPMNVHRWRKLEGSDPESYEMLQKIQTLQKRLIVKTEEVVEKNLQIQEKEKLYVELKTILARQPGPELAEKLTAYQNVLKEKTRQMKAMAAELNMFQAQVNEYKYEIERLTRELQDAKRKFMEQKRKEQLLREAHRELSAYQAIQESALDNPDIVGRPTSSSTAGGTSTIGGAAGGAQTMDSTSKMIKQSQMHQFQMNQTKYVGGGFALK